MVWDYGLGLHGIAASYTFRVYIIVSWRQLTHITYLPALVSFSSRLDNYMPYYPFSIFTIYMLYILIWCIYGCRFDGPDVRHFFFIIKMIETERSRKRGTLCSYTESERAVRFGIKKNLKKRREEKKMRWEKRKKWEALHSIALGNYIPTMNDDDDHLFSLSRLGWRDKVALAFNYNPRRKVKTDETGRTLIIIEKADFYFILFYLTGDEDDDGLGWLRHFIYNSTSRLNDPSLSPSSSPSIAIPTIPCAPFYRYAYYQNKKVTGLPNVLYSWLSEFLTLSLSLCDLYWTARLAGRRGGCCEWRDLWPSRGACVISFLGCGESNEITRRLSYIHQGISKKGKKKAQHFSVPYKNDIESY